MQSMLLATLFAAAAAADCPCGYAINATSSTDHAIFMEKLETDFTTGRDITWQSELGVSWRAQEYNEAETQSRGPYGKAAMLQNVVLNSLPENSTVGEGIHGGDPGLQLFVRSALVHESNISYVPIAEIASAREDILYGSFRVGMKTTTVNGTCGAFFFYHNDSQEIDVEFLSRELQGPSNIINFVNQSPQSYKAGYNAANTSTFTAFHTVVDPTKAYAEWRFDWLPDRIDFYANTVHLLSFYENIPNSPGAIHLSHWSNGDLGWSGGPPTKDAVLTISYINMYFNSSAGGEQCLQDACVVPDHTPSQPNAPNSSPSGSSNPMHSDAAPLLSFRGLIGTSVVLAILAAVLGPFV